MPSSRSSPESQSARVRVPASTSNLGPGFDVIGLALDLWLDARASVASGEREVRLVERTGCASDWPEEGRELLAHACELAHRRLGGSAGLRLQAHSQIPVGRGLGSSAAAVVAGLLLGAELAPDDVAREQLLEWAIDLEGHPDNVTPALFGGCQLTCPREGAPPRTVEVELHPELGFAVAWPAAPLETAFARSLLPREVPLDLAVDNARRLALVLEGLRRADGELLAAGNVEHLHVSQRLPHIHGGAAVLAAARSAGASLTTISGAGSALLAIATLERVEAVAGAMSAALAEAGAGGEARVLRPVAGPARVERG